MAEQNNEQCSKFAWNELMTNNTAECKEFFAKLLGWEAKDLPMGEGVYTVFTSAGQQVAGMMAIDPTWGAVPPHWMGYISVVDVDASAEKAVQLGGSIKMPPTDIPNIGRFCMIKDPSGAIVALMTFIPMES